jgi:hypothetical protein
LHTLSPHATAPPCSLSCLLLTPSLLDDTLSEPANSAKMSLGRVLQLESAWTSSVASTSSSMSIVAKVGGELDDPYLDNYWLWSPESLSVTAATTTAWRSSSSSPRRHPHLWHASSPCTGSISSASMTVQGKVLKVHGSPPTFCRTACEQCASTGSVGTTATRSD